MYRRAMLARLQSWLSIGFCIPITPPASVIARTLLLLAALASIALPHELAAQRCVRGKPCGNACIARERTCRLAPGTAVWAADADTSTRSLGDSGVLATLRSYLEIDEAPSIGRELRERCIVSRVVDGDTVWCTEGRKVRLLLMDAPERDQAPFGARSRAALLAMLPVGSMAQLEFDIQRHDRYGRELAYVYNAAGRLVNEEMLRAGYAVVLVYPPNVRYVERMRAAAAVGREERRGLWETSAFECAPVDHRRGRC